MRIPVSTYRLQLNSSFGFKETRAALSYLKMLGVSHIYASPILKARAGSQHGYDVVDPNQINPELGGEEEFDALAGELKSRDMFWLQDIVPNHMAYDKDNLMLMDIFEQREYSPFFRFFDIDWIHPFESFQGRVLAPFLGGFYSEILEKKEIRVALDENGFAVRYYDLRFPLLLLTYQDVLLCNIRVLEDRIGAGSCLMVKFLGVVDVFARVTQTHDERQYDQVRHAKNMLWRLYNENPEIRSFVDGNIAFLNGESGDPDALDAMDQLLSKQCYRLSFWKVASDELNYRRFFTVNELISLRVEKKLVFDHTHRLILRLIKEDKIHGLRIDHIDGLYDPATYLCNLREQARETYLVVEKILAPNEGLPAVLPVQGTTGYDFLNYANRLFCVKKNDAQLTKIYSRFIGPARSYERLVAEKKRLIIGKHMAGDIDNLAHLMKKVAGHHRFGRDITLFGLKRALVEVVTFFPVYRTYINCNDFGESDKRYIQEAIEKGRHHVPRLEHEIDFIRKFLLLELVENLDEDEKNEFWNFIMKFQQLTAPIMAKGFEDTVFYAYNKLLSLNEVGGDPALPGVEPDEFFEFLKKRAAGTPYSINATATHDTKRGEDVRARINVLSEIPEVWKAYLDRWSMVNRKIKRKSPEGLIPDANDEYFIYQTLLGSFPFAAEELGSYRERVKEYIVKAVREAKVHSAWIDQDLKYEEACVAFVEALLDQNKDNPFLESFQKLWRTVSHYGIFNSLSNVLIKMTAPGIPDLYQGAELWDLNLVDPDNRRPVKYDIRERSLAEIKDKESSDVNSLLSELLSHKVDGRIKLFLIYKALQFRKEAAALFQSGEFIPLQPEGTFKDCVISYAIKHADRCLVVIAPRFFTRLVSEEQEPLGRDVWQETQVRLPEGLSRKWHNVLTAEEVEQKGVLFLGDVLKSFPVALLKN